MPFLSDLCCYCKIAVVSRVINDLQERTVYSVLLELYYYWQWYWRVYRVEC